jgi:hypothetical protein
MLILGILYHINSMLGLRSRRNGLTFNSPVRGRHNLPVPAMLIVAMLLLILSLLAAADTGLGVGPLAE